MKNSLFHLIRNLNQLSVLIITNIHLRAKKIKDFKLYITICKNIKWWQATQVN